LSVKETPPGNVPVSVIVGCGARNPLVVTVNVLGAPAVKVVLFALVMVGAWAKAVETIAANARHDISHDASIEVAAKTRLRERGACGIIYVAIERRRAP
jgi:hypothetical protein